MKYCDSFIEYQKWFKVEFETIKLFEPLDRWTAYHEDLVLIKQTLDRFEQYIGKEEIDWDFISPIYVRSIRENTVIYIKDKNKAMLFKLAWG